MDDIAEVTVPTRRPRRLYAAGLAGTGLLAGVVLAGLNAASADPSPSPAPGQVAPDHRMRPFGHHRAGPGKGMHELGRALHGEFTTRAPEGGYQVLATQRGEVTAVSATSITVKSEDGYSRTYQVGDKTLVNAGNDGIADVKTGDTVHVVAVVKDGAASAVDIHDVTTVRELRKQWRPGGPKPTNEPAPSSAT